MANKREKKAKKNAAKAAKAAEQQKELQKDQKDQQEVKAKDEQGQKDQEGVKDQKEIKNEIGDLAEGPVSAEPNHQVTPSRDTDTGSPAPWPPRLPYTLSADANPFKPKSRQELVSAVGGGGDQPGLFFSRNNRNSSGGRYVTGPREANRSHNGGGAAAGGTGGGSTVGAAASRYFPVPTERRRTEFSRSAILFDRTPQQLQRNSTAVATPVGGVTSIAPKGPTSTTTFPSNERENFPLHDFSKPPPSFKITPKVTLEEDEEATNKTATLKAPIKHPLSFTWTLWYFGNENCSSWEDNLCQVSSFSTVEDFWALYHHVAPISELKSGTSYFLFKEGIKPMWEDDANRDGGRWVFQLVSKTFVTSA